MELNHRKETHLGRLTYEAADARRTTPTHVITMVQPAILRLMFSSIMSRQAMKKGKQ